jgi:hypothetical protein
MSLAFCSYPRHVATNASWDNFDVMALFSFAVSVDTGCDPNLEARHSVK